MRPRRAHFSIGSGTKLALESAIALADYLHAEPTSRSAFAKYEDARRVEVLRLQSAARNSTRMVRGGRALFPPRSGAVQLFAADPLAAHQPRESAAARQGLAGGRRGVVPAPGRRRRRTPRGAPMFAPFRLRDMKLEEPRRRLADGPVQGGRRLPDRLAFRPLRRARQGRRRARLYRDDLRQRRRAASRRAAPGCMRPSTSAAWKRIVDFVHRRDGSEDLRPARPFRRQGLDPARLGGERTRRCRRATGR